jgi:hypothetical protein
MATILVLTHPNDFFRSRQFLIQTLFPHWTDMGHRVVVHEGTADLPAADLAILHVDLTVIPDEYVEAMGKYRVGVNRATRDIGKRVVSANLVGPYDDYRGPVIVKTNANAGGIPERLHEEVARRKGDLPTSPVRYMSERYPIFASYGEVPAELRLDPALVVEKFLPERERTGEEWGYCSRHWIFLGDRDRCTRLLGPHPIVKGVDMIRRDAVPVPDEMRVHRTRLGFDFGKFDFVLHEGRPVLLDVNRTPALPGNLSEVVKAGMRELAKGIDALLG